MEATQAVLVTGASTGIGRKITELLADRNWFVYAGARSDSDLLALGRIKNVCALRLDVLNAHDISVARDIIANSGRRLYGLVNNAGIATVGSIVGGDEREFDLVLDTNVRGTYRVTNAFAPLVIAERGRIVMIGSISGILAQKGVGAYSMSKHAIEAFTDTLAEELEPFGVHVSVIEPGEFNTALVSNAERRSKSAWPLPDLSKYEPPDQVAAAIAHALFDPKPKRRYLVVSREGQANNTIRTQIERLVQLNETHQYTYDRDALVRMLDRALTRVS